MKWIKDNGKNGIVSFILFLTFFSSVHSQVGINTEQPQVTLDIRGVNHNGPVTSEDGILVPRVNDISTPGSEDGQLVYLIEDVGGLQKGFYYWNGIKWSSFSKNSSTNSANYLVEPDATIAGTAGSPVSFTNSITRAINDNQALDVIFPVSGIVGNTTLVTISIQVRHNWDADLDIFLGDPTGRWLELSTDNGGSGEDYYTTLFTDAATTNITAGFAPFNGSYRPEGSLSNSGTPINRTGTITNLAGFNGLNSNGNWTLRIGDDENIIEGTFVSATLNISGTASPPNWILLGEVAMDYLEDSAIIVQSSYSGDPEGSDGLLTALTRTNSSIAVGTPMAALPGTILNYASASPGGPGDMWVNTYNLARDVGLTDNTTYYYQLWRKGNIETPVASNETFNLIPMRIQE